ncbi:hypothetical protein L228DRAFT_266030 [Xylona heveae TC161]|uniref:LsmAD domain-containing protein n=1 Tax=Xylona heveae (strain CBS 132557 / TC161) TaxID=1328760 RepID=A0A165IYV1_XYLHT|nr:hypothetical protein L228DRAFT_266030 [Xylona heveae TC161]KZF25565.1 hypothetical protein L228DRAFT_266030 [Xylona heveae TC161]
MASPATASPVSVNGSAPNGASSNTSADSSTNTGGRPQLKSTSSGRSLDANRRQAPSPMEATQRKSPAPKAWAQGTTNPITQRPSNFNTSNGNAAQNKPANPPKTSNAVSKETNTPEKHANDRLVYLLANFMGLQSVITVKSGDKFSGIFSGASLDTNESAYVLKMVKQIGFANNDRVNGATEHDTYIGSGADFSMTFEIKDVIDLAVEEVNFHESRPKPSSRAGFRTDTDISSGFAARERTLQRWEPSADSEVDMSLESTTGAAGWDQFEANKRLYGLESDYDETMYTTSINRNSPLYHQRAAHAERIAQEIESGNTTNAHVAEERGIKLPDSGLSEEDKYSGVQRGAAEFPPLTSGRPNKYTPPAKRPPTGQPTVPGAPVDPAIISSQISRASSAAAAKKPAEFKATENKPASPATIPGATQQTVVAPADTDKLGEKPAEKAAEKQADKPTEDTTEAAATASVPTKEADSTAALPSKPVQSIKTPELVAPTSGKPGAPSVPAVANRTGPENATANVETELLDSFKQFANSEKMRVQERKRNQASHDKAIKINDLMKFSKNFKLMTPVPKDLVPILAKDKMKQEEIMLKAQKAAEEAKAAAPKSPAKAMLVGGAESKPTQQRPVSTARYDPGTSAPMSPADRQAQLRGRSAFSQASFNNHHGPRNDRALPAQNIPSLSPRGPALSQRLANIQQQNRAGAPHSNVPSPMPIQEGRLPPTGPAMASTPGLPHPLKNASMAPPGGAASTKFNVKALEFKPNPAATSFTPGRHSSISSSPKAAPSAARPTPRVSSPATFFGNKKPLPSSERPSISNAFNPIKRMKTEAEAEKKDFSSNGGIKHAYATPPTWTVTKENENKTYLDMFEKVTFVPHTTSPAHVPPMNAQLPHQHQLPFHLQQGAPGLPPTQLPLQGPVHPPHFPAAGPHHFDDHRMHPSSSASSVFPSPRLQQINMAYPSPMPQPAQLAAYGQPMPQYAMAPAGPQLAHLRQYPGAPQFVNAPGAHLGAPMMVHQPTAPFMGMPQGMGVPIAPQMAMYSPSQGHAYAQHAGPPPPPPGSNGYPSPGRGAPMMIHQGSQPGQAPQQMMWMSPGHQAQPVFAPQQPGQMAPMRAAYPPPQQPPFGTNPHQPQQLPPQPHRAGPNGTYAQPMPPHQVAQPPPSVAAASHAPETTGEESK